MTAAAQAGRERCSCGRTLIARPGELADTCAECRHIPNACSCPALTEGAYDAPGRAGAEPPFREFDLAALVRDGVPAAGAAVRGPAVQGRPALDLRAAGLREDHDRAVVDAAGMSAPAGPAVFLDEEGGAELVAEKLIALGATPEEAGRIRYFPFPARTWNAYDVIVLRELLDDIKPDIMLWDSSAAFLSRAGLDENSAGDVTKFWAQVLTPVAREHGVAVLVIDHDTKNGEASRFARGSGAKLAACDVAFKVSIAQAFDRTTNGVLRMQVTKDRRGWLHRYWEIGINTGSGMTLNVHRDRQRTASPGRLKLTPAAVKVQAVLTASPAPFAS